MKFESQDLTGKVYGRYTIISFAGMAGGHKLWHAICQCGTEKVVRGYDLHKGNVVSCGCYQKERSIKRLLRHGMTDTRIHNIWLSMLYRCSKPSNKSYERYGGRGIKVCKRWHKFENFYADMGEKPEGLSLERRDNNGGYSPENCYWADRKTQSNNRRDNVKITFNGITHNLCEWGRICNIHYYTICKRLKRGWSIEKALTIKPSSSNRYWNIIKED